MAPTNIWIAASDGNVDYVRELISSGAHTPNDKDPNGYTPLHAATSYGHTDLLRYLLNNGGDISIADNDGDTLLHIVEDLKTAQMLVEEFNADWKAKNEEGQTPLTKLEDEEEFPELIAYFRSLAGSTIVPVSDSAEASTSATPASSLIDTLFCNPNVQLSYENMPDDESTGKPLLSEEQFKEVETIINGENAEEELTKYLTKIVGNSIRGQESPETSTESGREKKQKHYRKNK